MGWFGPFIYKDKNKKKWWLHSKEFNKKKFYFFSKDDVDALPDLPPGYEVTFNEKSGIPLLRKTEKKKMQAKLEKEMLKQ